MIYEVEKKPKRLPYPLLDRAVLFASEFLDLNVDLTIEFRILRKQHCGFCDYYEDDAIIIIDRYLSVEDIIRTLFHEMVHVKQYDAGRLEHGSSGIWLGVLCEGPYEDLPWELEAYQLEQKMMDAFYC